MKKKYLKTILLSTIIALGVPLFLMPTVATADSKLKINACDSIDKNKTPIAWEANGCNDATKDRLPDIAINILNVIIGVSGLIAVVFIILGGIQYMTSSGDAAKVKKAKDTILYACIGLIVCVLAFAIVNWVINVL